MIKKLPIAVDDHARVILHYRGSAHPLGQLLGQRAGADVPGQVAATNTRIDSHVAQNRRNSPAGVVTHQ